MNTFAEKYEELLKRVYNNPNYVSNPRGMEVKECLNTVVTCHPAYGLYENKIRSTNLKYLAGELLWYFSGRNDVEFISKYSKFWKNIANEDGTCNSAYGNLIFKENPNEWNWALESLLKDKDSRQAIIHFNKPIHIKETKDFPCTVYGIFHIRNNELHFTIHMRSQDLILGAPFDYPFFMLLQQVMWLQLMQKYPELDLGMYTHICNSSHIYQRNYELVENMLKETFLPNCLLVDSQNPILHKDIIAMTYEKEYKGYDLFFKWLNENR